MSRIEDLEQRVRDLERNVGSAMGQLNLTAMATPSTSKTYMEGMRTPIKTHPGKTIDSIIPGAVNYDGEYVISEDKDYKKGNGTKVYIKDGKIICDVADECGNAGGEWFCDIELLRYHIELYKSLTSDIDI